METVKRFINDEHMVKDVKNAVIDILEKEIVSQAYAGNDVSAIAQAKQVFVKALQQLESEYGIKKQESGIDHTE